MVCFILLSFWVSLLGQHNVTWYCWNSAGPLRWRVSESLPSRSKLSPGRRGASFPAGGQLVWMLDFLMNGLITLSVSCLLDHPAPSWRCLWRRIMAPLLSSPKQCFCNVTHWRTVSGLSHFLSGNVACFEHESAFWRLENHHALQRHSVTV